MLLGVSRAMIVSILMVLLQSTVRGDQMIIESPISTEVLKGTDVTLRCTVQNQAGAVQWTKNGFGLGTERSLSVFERYQMIGASDEYHLHIKNVQLEDDGVYQCQLMATEQHQPVHSDVAKLTVLLTPKFPYIEADSDTGTVNRDYLHATERVPVHATCTVDGGKPAARLRWAIASDVRLDAVTRWLSLPISDNKSGTTSVGTTRSATRDQIDEVTDINDEGITTTRSLLTYFAQAVDDGQYLLCIAEHRTLDSPQIIGRKLDVNYAPRVHVTLNRTHFDQPAGLALNEKDGALLQCDVDAKPASNVQLLWYRDNVPVKHANTRMLAIETLDRSFNGSRFACKATNDVGEGVGTITLDVHYEPIITFSSPRQAATEGGTVTLECEVDSNPPAKVSWTRRDRAGVVLHVGNNFTIENVRQTHQGIYICTATNAASPAFRPSSREIPLLINGPPKVRIMPADANIGSVAELRCQVFGYPFPTDVAWTDHTGRAIDTYRDSRFEESTIEGADSVMNVLRITDVRRGDFHEYNCTARNQYGVDSGVIMLRQLDVLPLYLLVPGVCAASILLLLVLICICLTRRNSGGRKMPLSDNQSDVTVKVETLDGRDYPNMYNNNSPLDGMHVTYGKDYVSIPQDIPDVDILPPPYAHYAQLHANGTQVYSSLHRNSAHLDSASGALVHMTYMVDNDNQQATIRSNSMSARETDVSPSLMRNGRPPNAPIGAYPATSYSNTPIDGVYSSYPAYQKMPIHIMPYTSTQYNDNSVTLSGYATPHGVAPLACLDAVQEVQTPETERTTASNNRTPPREPASTNV